MDKIKTLLEEKQRTEPDRYDYDCKSDESFKKSELEDPDENRETRQDEEREKTEKDMEEHFTREPDNFGGDNKFI